MVEEEDIMKIIRHYLKYGLVFVAVTMIVLWDIVVRLWIYIQMKMDTNMNKDSDFVD